MKASVFDFVNFKEEKKHKAKRKDKDKKKDEENDKDDEKLPRRLLLDVFSRTIGHRPTGVQVSAAAGGFQIRGHPPKTRPGCMWSWQFSPVANPGIRKGRPFDADRLHELTSVTRVLRSTCG